MDTYYSTAKLNLFCPDDQEPVRSICLYQNCQRRLLCRKCLKIHTQSHLNSMAFIEDIIDESVIHELETVMLQMESKRSNGTSTVKNLIEEIEQIFSELENFLLNLVSETRASIIQRIKELAFPNTNILLDIQKLKSDLQVKFTRLKSGDNITSEFIEDFALNYSKVDKAYIQRQDQLEFTVNVSPTLNLPLITPKLDEMQSMARNAFAELEVLFVTSCKAQKNELDVNRFAKISTFSNPYDDVIWDVAYMKGRDYYITGGSNGRLAVYNMRYEAILICVAHQDGINVVRHLPYRDYILTGSNDGLVKIWQLDTLNKDKPSLMLVDKFENHHSNVYAIEYIPEFQQIASAGNDKTLRVWDIEKAGVKEIQILHFFEVISSLLYQVSEKRLVVGMKDGNIATHLVNREGKISPEVYLLAGHTSWIFALTEMRETIFSGSDDCTIRQWRMEFNSGTCLRVFPKQGMYVRGLAAFDNDVLLTMNCDNKLRIWKISTLEVIREFISPHSFGQSILFIREKGQVATAFGKEVNIWKVA